jgi:putative membrane protein
LSDPDPPGQGEGRRLHPLGLIVSLVTQLPNLALPILAALFGTRRSNLGAVQVIAAVLAFSLLFRWLGWLRFRYWIDSDDIRIERGLIKHSARSIPFDRIADVAIEQRPLARILSLAEVRFETGGGAGEDANLSFVSLEEAERLRETVRAHKAHDPLAQPAAEPDAAEPAPLFAMDNRRLVTLGVYSFSLVIFAVLAGAAQQFDFLLPFDLWAWESWVGAAQSQGVDVAQLDRSAQAWGALLALLALVAIGTATGIGQTFLTNYGFRLDRTAKGFRRRRGLLTHTDMTLPVQRVQAAAIHSGAIRVRGGWHSLQLMSLADENAKERDHAMAPLAQLAEIAPILGQVGLALPPAGFPFRHARAWPWIDRALVVGLFLTLGGALATRQVGGLGWGLVLLALPYAGLCWLDWQRSGYACKEGQLYCRHGWWNRWLALARMVNVQSVSIHQGPLQRLRGLCSIEFGIAGGALRFVSVPLGEARDIRARVIAEAAPIDFSRLGLRP